MKDARGAGNITGQLGQGLIQIVHRVAPLQMIDLNQGFAENMPIYKTLIFNCYFTLMVKTTLMV